MYDVAPRTLRKRSYVLSFFNLDYVCIENKFYNLRHYHTGIRDTVDKQSINNSIDKNDNTLIRTYLVAQLHVPTST